MLRNIKHKIATHPAKTRFPLLRHHLPDERQRTVGIPEDERSEVNK